MKSIRKPIVLSLVLMLICGVIYPLFMTAVSQVLFRHNSNGSIIMYDGKPAGSELLGQNFTDPRFFHGRVSSINYNTYSVEDKDKHKFPASGSSNLAPSNPALKERVESDLNKLLAENPEISKDIVPIDILTESGSGLDPDISPESAMIQVPRISKATGISEQDLEIIIKNCTEGRQFGIFGEPRVNVLKANIEIYRRLK